MPGSREFVERFRWVAHTLGWRDPPLPGAALQAWEELVAECIEGYEGDLSEYLNDLAIRGLLQEVLNDPVVRMQDQHSWFSPEVHRIDERFEEVLKGGPVIWPEGAHWWNQRIPSIGSEEFVNDVRERYSVELRSVDC
jgi:hypothetical protein